ncbi:hypothetical protein F4775DRAFT_67015 [Biscogniauxia sp. FL1348]|nr:hypothetical protein F4775DRAFT_67015 [Biscogniauxia sp. FL1348]
MSGPSHPSQNAPPGYWYPSNPAQVGMVPFNPVWGGGGGNVAMPQQNVQGNPAPPQPPPQRNAVSHLLENGVDPLIAALFAGGISPRVANLLTGSGAQRALALFPPSASQLAASASGGGGSPAAASATAAAAAAAPVLASLDPSVSVMFAVVAGGGAAVSDSSDEDGGVKLYSPTAAAAAGGGAAVATGVQKGVAKTSADEEGAGPAEAYSSNMSWESSPEGGVPLGGGAPGGAPAAAALGEGVDPAYAQLIQRNINQEQALQLIQQPGAKENLKAILKGPLGPDIIKKAGEEKKVNPRLDPSRRPRNFEERYRAENYKFHLYRKTGRPRFSPEEEAWYRTKWLQYHYPREGTANPRASRMEPRRPTIYGRPPKQPSLLDDAPGLGDARFQKVRERFRRASTWFQKKGPFEFVRPLGYGGLGLTIQYKYTEIEPALNLVLKIALHGWTDRSLSNEEESTRQVARAAHCVQMIPPEKVGMGPKKRSRFKQPNFLDSSDEGISSGEESRGEEPKEKPKSRRWMLINERQKMQIKLRAFADRKDIWKGLVDQRNELLRARARKRQEEGEESQASSVGDPANDQWELDYKDYLLLEFAENGDLANFIYKINETRQRVPNRVLWSFWLCLVSACVAMEYPPRKFHPKRRDPDPVDSEGFPTMDFADLNSETRGKRIGPDLYEDVPDPSRRWAGRRQVHFDIDPKNILIYGLDPNTKDNEHKLIPRLKLADFGLAQRMKPNKSNAYYWEKRNTGKLSYLTPEQFGEDWEYVPARTIIGPEISEQPVAGNYAAHTNVWAIALSLWQLMTGARAPLPPEIEPTDDPNAPVSYCTLINTWPQFAYIDADLKKTIYQCSK